ncbi:MAG: hypothetical protein K2X86_13690 [Cytophagaceae bacterium]|nr:hypothetical protein [Cytophagaceae bacterium]
MAITRLKRKERKNSTVVKQRKAKIKLLTKTPVIKKVDLEELRKQSNPSVVEKVKEKVTEVADAVKKTVKKIADKE